MRNIDKLDCIDVEALSAQRIPIACGAIYASARRSKAAGGTFNPDLAGEGYSYYGLPPPDGVRSTPEHHLHCASTLLNGDQK
ncbi:unnamed protein product [Pieris macdunnoughi]|uniref:Uncharacterized protein n=1 Tax=Pieris macdunnoughi TaxID=345717 RepID=A0A821R2V7_9NEOP|nr:unnamed protein product [Pieris macdunnoughi]